MGLFKITDGMSPYIGKPPFLFLEESYKPPKHTYLSSKTDFFGEGLVAMDDLDFLNVVRNQGDVLFRQL